MHDATEPPTKARGDLRARPAGSSWPGVVGGLGILVALVLLVDKLEDLLQLTLWPSEAWRQRFTPALADLVVQSMPPAAWTIPAALVGVALALLLLVGSIGVLRRRRQGVALCRTWSTLAILWGLVEIVVASVLLQRLALEAPQLVPAGWAGSVATGIFLALVLVLAFPVFLLLWFARPAVRRDTDGWGD